MTIVLSNAVEVQKVLPGRRIVACIQGKHSEPGAVALGVISEVVGQAVERSILFSGRFAIIFEDGSMLDFLEQSYPHADSRGMDNSISVTFRHGRAGVPRVVIRTLVMASGVFYDFIFDNGSVVVRIEKKNSQFADMSYCDEIAVFLREGANDHHLLVMWGIE